MKALRANRLKKYRDGARWLYLRFKRWWDNSALSTVNWALGWGIVFMLSTHYDWSTQHTRYGVSFVWALPTFIMHRKLLWGDRNTCLRSSSTRWWSYWLVSQAANIGVSIIVVWMSGLPFLLVCVILFPYTMFLPYLIRDKWVFKEPKTATV